MGAQEAPAKAVGFRELGRFLRDGAGTIGKTTALVLALLVLVTMFSYMRFRVTGSLYLGDVQNREGTAGGVRDEFDVLGAGRGDVGTEVEILRSTALVEHAIVESGFNVSLTPLGWHAPRYLRWRLSHRNVDSLDLGARHLSVEARLPATASRKQAFTLRVKGDREFELVHEGNTLGTAAFGAELQTPLLTITARPGPDGLPASGAEFDLKVEPISDVADDLSHVLIVSTPTRKSAVAAAEPVDVVDIELTDESPRRAAAFVNALMRGYLERRQSWRNEEATAAEQFVAGQLDSLKQSLDDAEGKLAEFKKGSDVAALSDAARGMVDQLGRYEEERVAAHMQVTAFGRMHEILGKRDVPLEQYLVGETDDPVLSSLSNNLVQAQQELRRDEQLYTGDAPAVHEQKAQVDTQIKMIRNYVLSRFQRAQEQLGSLDAMIKEYNNKVSTLPHAQLALAQLTRNADVLSKMYSFLQERQQQAAVTKASTISKNHVLDAPELPFREDSPALVIRVSAGILLGLFLGIGRVLWRKLTASTFTNELELRSWLGDLPVVGVIPTHAGWRPSDPSFHGPLSRLEHAPRSSYAEAFRHLRANVYRSLPGDGGAIIVVTSPSRGDGKSTTCLALAAMFAADGRRALVVDGNPSESDGRDFASADGLAEVLAGEVSWNDAVNTVAGAFGTFDFLSGGSPAATGGELLSGAPFRALLKDMRSIYQIVLVEAPPFPALCDAYSLAPSVDAILTIIRVQHSDRAASAAHVDQLAQANPRYGVIINADHTVSPSLVAGTAPVRWSYGAASASPTSRRITHGQPSAE